ncbi:MAG: LysR substrate-binding domain-containing protein [Pseudomonadota bacterium]
MLDQLRQIAIFAKTVDHGSFRGAARALELSPSVVSYHIAQLEERLGTALLYRSTRKLSLTEDGERLLAKAHAMIEAAEDGLQIVANHAAEPSGLLRITLPAVLAQSDLVDRIAGFTSAHTKVRLELDFSDVRRELIADGMDVAIRMGWLRDSALKARKLYDVERRLVAASSYLAGRDRPKSPTDLADWNWVGLTPAPRGQEFCRPDRKTIRLSPRAQISVNDASAIYRLVRAGAGIAVLPDYLFQQDLADGSVEVLLEDWTVAELGVYAVWPPNAPKDGLIARFVGHLAA